MAIFSVFIVNKAGGLIYQYDHNTTRPEVEKTFSYPLDVVLKIYNERLVVVFGERDGIKVGHTVLAINGINVEGLSISMDDGQKEDPSSKVKGERKDVLQILADEQNYPINIKFGRPKLSTNEKIIAASTFHSLFAIGSQLSPEPRSSGIELLETDSFKLHCFQTMTGVKFIVLADPRQSSIDSLLRKLHEVYADYALKNPFYSLDMPIRCELFDVNLQASVEYAERLGISNV